MALALALGALACPTSTAFNCESDGQCPNGLCQSTGYCSFPDSDCESGQRYGALAGGGLAGDCVEPPDGGTSSAGTSTAASTTLDPETSLDTTASATTGTASTTPLTMSGPSTTLGDTSMSDGSTGVGPGTGDGTSTTGPVVCPEIFDDFEDGTIHADWFQSVPADLSEMDGALAINITPDVDAFPAVLHQTIIDLSNDGYVRTRVEDTSIQPVVEMLLRVIQSTDGDSDEYQIVVFDENMCARFDPGGAPHMDLECDPFDSFEDRWLQIRADSGSLHFETSPDGTNWDVFHTENAPLIPLEEIEVGLQAGNTGALAAAAGVSFGEFEACGG